MTAIQTSLSVKIFWVIAGMSLVLVLLTSILEIRQEAEQTIIQEQREARAAVYANRDALSLSLWSLDERAIETIARSLVSRTGIFRVEIVEDDKIAVGVTRPGRALTVDQRWQVPLFRPGTRDRVGLLRVFENYDDERERVRRRAVSLVGAEIAKVLALSVFLFVLVHLWVTRPLAHLARQVQEQGAAPGGTITVDRPLHGGYDEIDSLVDAVNFNQQERRRMAEEESRRRAREAQTGKLAAFGQLAGGIAHDFNNILGAILGFGNLLARDMPRESQGDHYLQRMLASAERGRDLVKQILAFARAGELDRAVVDLCQIVRQSEHLLTAALPKSTRLQFSLPREVVPVKGNGGQLGQLVVNLVVNASEALGGKAGLVSVEVSSVAPEELQGLESRSAAGEHLAGSLDLGRRHARLRVTDSGEGIAPDVLDRIFEPFFTTKGRHHGTGLGLAVVHGVVESHGGACHIRSRPASGSVFSIYLPLSDELPAAPAAPPAVSAALGGSERLLIVDDEQDIVDMLAAGFERLGYDAVGVNDPVEALAAFREDPAAFDLVITDQVMPSMSGLELTRILKAERPDLHVILCSGYSDNLSEASARKAGAALFYVKPVDAFGISAGIRSLMDAPVDAPAGDENLP
jgi:signal transduction histidine kinase/CheY-like chemotaxis protein